MLTLAVIPIIRLDSGLRKLDSRDFVGEDYFE
jgi:hypothetical protein